MSVIFALAIKEINSSDKDALLLITGGHKVLDVAEVGVVKSTPGLAYAISRDDYDELTTYYFQIKDLVGFKADYREEEKEDEPQED